ncbi:uracil phosphoribosyltransferase [Planctomycetales bacterium ZRK34]|nr:uracil phosphoribosyltransferase [Planctomycetales bacterium ZRK34]
MGQVYVNDHPLVADGLTQLRDAATGSAEFRRIIARLTYVQTNEALRDLKLKPVEVTTPLTTTQGQRLAERIAIVPILRAGLGMVDAMLEAMPDAEVRHLGFYRDEQTLQPVEYYHKLPSNDPPDVAVVVDPMLATGGSANAAIEALKRWAVPRIKLMSILGAPEGVAAVQHAHSDVSIYVCTIDEKLNDHGYIMPGLGDAGDRIFGT